MSENVLLKQNVQLKTNACDWAESMRKSGQLLVDSNFITKEYIESTIKSVEEFGPYIVIAPGLALAHARPDESVLKSGLSLITLNTPVNFDCENDPVDIVLTLAAKDNEDHLKLLQTLSLYLSEEGKMDFIRNCTDVNQLVDEINNFSIA